MPSTSQSKNTKKRHIRDAFEAFYAGDSFTNAEAIEMHKILKASTDCLVKMPERYKIAFHSAVQDFDRMDNICRARELIQ